MFQRARKNETKYYINLKEEEMEIKGSVQEIKELFKNFEFKEEKRTSFDGTTDDIDKIGNKIGMLFTSTKANT